MNSEDMSDVFEKINNLAGKNNISPDMVNNLFNMLNNSNSSNTASNSTSDPSNLDKNHDTENSTNSIDIETIMRMKTIIDKMNVKDDPRANLLQSLKPYLKESRQSKVDQYIQLMNMSKVMEVFPFMGGDKKK